MCCIFLTEIGKPRFQVTFVMQLNFIASFPQKIFVMPNMDDVYIPLMHSAMDPRSSTCPPQDLSTEASDQPWHVKTLAVYSIIKVTHGFINCAVVLVLNLCHSPPSQGLPFPVPVCSLAWLLFPCTSATWSSIPLSCWFIFVLAAIRILTGRLRWPVLCGEGGGTQM